MIKNVSIDKNAELIDFCNMCEFCTVYKQLLY